MKRENDYRHVIDLLNSKKDSKTLILPYQEEAVKALDAYYHLDNNKGIQSGLMVMPTGSGKTFTAVYWLLNRAVAKGYKIVWLVHRQELVSQAEATFVSQCPLLKEYGMKKIRIISVSGIHLHMSSASRAEINVCSIQSVANKYGYRFISRMLGVQGKEKLIVVIDEAHHAVSPSYQKVLNRFMQINPNTCILGLTATPTRMQTLDRNKLYNLFKVTQNIDNNCGTDKGFIYEISLKQLILNGALAKPIYERVKTEIDADIEFDLTLSDELFFKQFGELSEKIKNQIAESEKRNGLIVNQYLNNRDKYGKTLIFAINREHARTLCNLFIKNDVSCDYVISDKPNSAETIERFRNNEFEVLINVQIMTEGTDVPDIKSVFMTRETNSDSLMMQMIGRGLRGEAAGGTKEEYIVDFHDTWEKLKFWLDPSRLDIFEQTEIAEDEIPLSLHSETDEMIEEEQVEKNELDTIIGNESFNMKEHVEIYNIIYNSLRMNLHMKDETTYIPCGWYAVLSDSGEDKKVLVYEKQIESYQSLKAEIPFVLEENIDVAYIRERFFTGLVIQPDVDEQDLALIWNMVLDTNEMPEYFSFEQKNLIDPKVIYNKMTKLFSKSEEQEEWLKRYYDDHRIVQQIYRYFYAFKTTVLNAKIEKSQSIIEQQDEREKYHIIDNYYDLYEIMNELLVTYSDLNIDNLKEVSWSVRIVKSWFGICRRTYMEESDNYTYKININRLLSSPDIDREVVKYVLFHELLHQNGLWNHDCDFREKEWSYPNSEELDGRLDELALLYNIEDIFKNRKQYRLKGQTSKLNKNSEGKVLGIVEGYKYCRNCGNRLPQDSKFCDRCGIALEY